MVPQSSVQAEPLMHSARQLGATQVKAQVLPPLQLQVASAHSAVQVLP